MLQLEVTGIIDPRPVQMGAISALQVDDVWPHYCLFLTKFIFNRSLPKLYYSVLFGARWMIERDVDDRAITPK